MVIYKHDVDGMYIHDMKPLIYVVFELISHLLFLYYDTISVI